MNTFQSVQTTNKIHSFLTTKLRLSPLKIFVIVLAIGLLDELLIGYLSGYWESTSLVLGVRDDYPHWIVSFVFQPAVWAFFLWLLPAVTRVSDGIWNEAIPESHKDAYHQSQFAFLHFINSPVISWLSLALGIFLVVLSHYFTAQYIPAPWTYYVEWHRYTIWSVRLLAAGYSISFTGIYSILVMIQLYKVFKRYGVRLQLYHGDNVAGLKFIGDFVLKLNRLALISISFLVSDLLLALQVGRGVFGQKNLVSEMIAFPMLTLISFIVPLISCHWAMKDAKTDELNRQAAKIEVGYQSLQSTPDVSKEQIERLTTLIDFRERLRTDIPTLPVDITGIRTFSVSFVASLIPAVIGIIIDLLMS